MNKENTKLPTVKSVENTSLVAAKPTDSSVGTKLTRSQRTPAIKPAAKPIGRSTLPTRSTATSKAKVSSTLAAITATTRSNKLKPAAVASIEQPPLKRKRKEYDVKGRLQDLEEQHQYTFGQLAESNKLIENMKDMMAKSDQEMSSLKVFKESLLTDISTKDSIQKELQEKLDRMDQEKSCIISDHLAKINTLEIVHKRAIDEKLSEISQLSARVQNLTVEYDTRGAEITQYKSTIASQSAASFGMESEIVILKSKLEQEKQNSKAKEIQISNLLTEKAYYLDSISKLEALILDHEGMRRSLHNTIQELRGNIRVFCRIRPLLPQENEVLPITFSDDSIQLSQTIDTASGKQVLKPYHFAFDKVFQQDATQALVFDEICQLVQSALDGYNVSIFAYGQTGKFLVILGSGKTFTMEGPHVEGSAVNQLHGLNDPQAGMIPRAVQQIYECCEKLQSKGWKYTMEAQFVEIYNETLRDLLDASGSETKKMDIKHDRDGKTYVTDCTTVLVNSPQEVFLLLERASTNRAVAATNCNERSSRSHSVFTLKLTGINSSTEESCYGVLNLIDLAGSERLSSSGSTGDRLKETQAINKSLSSLGDVVAALANKDSHVPFRNSKVFYFLTTAYISFAKLFGGK